MSHSLQHAKIAKRYVNSLFASFSKPSDSKNAVKDMADLSAMIGQSKDLQNFMKSPLLSKEQQVKGVEALAKQAKFSKNITNLLMILAENRRLSLVPLIAQEIEAQLARESGTVPVMIATARKLSATDQKKIGADIKAVLGKDILMQAYVDESLIGGIVLQVESTLIDGSIQSKLDKLERELTHKAA